MQLSADVKHAATEVIAHPKLAWFVTIAINWANMYVQWVSPVIDALTSVGSFALIVLLVRYHLKNSRKLDQDYEIGQENLKQMKRRKTDDQSSIKVK